MNADFLYYGGCFVLQTGNISLALTDSMGQAMQAAREIGSNTQPYWTTYTLPFTSPTDYDVMVKRIQNTCGVPYLSPFIANFNENELVIGGFCLI